MEGNEASARWSAERPLTKHRFHHDPKGHACYSYPELHYSISSEGGCSPSHNHGVKQAENWQIAASYHEAFGAFGHRETLFEPQSLANDLNLWISREKKGFINGAQNPAIAVKQALSEVLLQRRLLNFENFSFFARS